MSGNLWADLPQALLRAYTSSIDDAEVEEDRYGL